MFYQQDTIENKQTKKSMDMKRNRKEIGKCDLYIRKISVNRNKPTENLDIGISRL